MSTIQEERTSQMFSPEAQENTNQHSETLQNSTEDHEPISISIGKADAAGDLSISIGNQELTLSLYQTPDLTERDARHVCEMFAEELAESVTESKYVELPPLRFMRETAKSSNINMEAIIIDIDQQGFEEYESLRLALENVDDLKTEADIDEVSMAEWIEEPVNVREYEALACEEIFELDDDRNEIVQIMTESEKLQMLSESNIKKEEVYSPDATSASLGKDENSVSKDLISDSLTKKQKEVKEKAAEAKQKSAQKPASHGTSNTENSQKEQDNKSLISAPGNELQKDSIKTDLIQTRTKEKNNEIKDMNSELKITEANISETLAIIEESKLEKNDLSLKHNIHENVETLTTHDPKPISSTSERGEVKGQAGIVNDTVIIDQHNSSKKDRSECLISKNKEEDPSVKTSNKESIILTANETKPEEKITISNEIEKSINQFTFQGEKKQIETDELITEASIKTLNKQEPAEVSAQGGSIVKTAEDSLASSNQEIKNEDSTENKTKEPKRKSNENENVSRTDDQKTNDIETVTPEVDGSYEKIASKVEENQLSEEILAGQDDKLEDITTEQTKQQESSIVKEKSVVNVKGIITGEEGTETTIDGTPDVKDPKVLEEEKIETKSPKDKDRQSTKETETEEVTKTTENESTSSSAHVISDLSDKILNKEVVVGDQNNSNQPNEGFEGALTKKQKEIKEKALASKNKCALASPQLSSKTDSKSKDAVSSIENDLEEQILPTDPLMEEISKDNPEVVKIPAKRTALEILALDILEIHKPIFEMTQIPELTGEVVEQSKPVTRQTSVVDSESLPDIETFNKEDPIKAENKYALDDDDEDFEFDEEAYRRQRRASSYEDAIANMDPDILKELGISTGDTMYKSSNEQFDLDQLPVETTMERMSRIEEKALQIALEEDIVPRKSRSRSRSRSKSRPPGLDTVIEKSKEEKAEAKYYEEKGLMALPSLDTIKESPSTASVVGLLYGGFSSASINTVLQGSQSSASVHKDLEDMATLSPRVKQKFEHDKIKEVDEPAIENLESTVSSLNTEKDNLYASQREPKEPTVSCSNVDNITSHQNEPELTVTDETEVLGRNEQCEQIAPNSTLEKDLMDKSRIDSGIEVSTQDEDSVKPVTKSRKKKAQRTQTKQILPGNDDDEKLLDIDSMTDEPQEYTSNLKTPIENTTASETPSEHQQEESDIPQVVISSELIKEMKLDLTSDINENVKEFVDKTLEPLQNQVEPHEKDKKKTNATEDIAVVPELHKKESLKKEIDLDDTPNEKETHWVKEPAQTNLDAVKDNIDLFDKADKKEIVDNNMVFDVCSNNKLGDKNVLSLVSDTNQILKDTATKLATDQVDQPVNAKKNNQEIKNKKNEDEIDNVQQEQPESEEVTDDLNTNKKKEQSSDVGFTLDTGKPKEKTAMFIVPGYVEKDDDLLEGPEFDSVIINTTFTEAENETFDAKKESISKEETETAMNLEEEIINKQEKHFEIESKTDVRTNDKENKKFKEEKERINQEEEIKKEKEKIEKENTALKKQQEEIEKQEIERKKLEDKIKKQEELKRQEEEIKRLEEERKKHEEEENKKQEAEDRKRQEENEIRRQKEEEEKKKLKEDEIKKQEEEDKKNQIEEKAKWEKKEEKERKQEEEKKKKEEEERRKEEEEKRKEEEKMKALEKEEKRKEGEEKRKEEEKRKALEKEEKLKQAEKEKAEAKALEEEKIRRKEEEKNLEEEKIQKEKEEKKLEEEKRKILEEKLKKEAEEKLKKEANEKEKQESAKKAEKEEQERKEKEEKAKKELTEKRLREELEMKKKQEETAKKEAEEKSRKEEVERKKREKEEQEKTRKEEEEARLKEEERKELEKKKKEEQRIQQEKKMEEEKAKQILKEKEEKLQEIERQKAEQNKKKEAEDKKMKEKDRKEAQENKNKKEPGEKIPTSEKKTKALRKQTVDQKRTPERRLEEKSENKDVKEDLSKGFDEFSKSNQESLGNSQSADVMNAYCKAQKSDTYSMKSFGTETKDSGYHSSQGGRLSSSERSKFDYGLENQHSSSYDSRTRNISGDSYYKETVEKSMQTSNNLMSMVTGSLAPKPEPSRPKPQAQKVEPKNKASESRMNKSKAEESKTTPPGGVSDIMIKEVGCNWVSLCWKKPAVTRGSPILTYKVEAWLCGEGAFWVEIGRTPIPQYDVFNLKPNKCYHFRVTARNKQGWGDSIMTTHKVDLNKPTQMPKISSELDPIVKTFNGSDLRLAVSVSGEPSPSIKWMRDNEDINTLEGYNVYQDEIGCYVEISNINSSYAGKYTVTASNLAGRASKSIMVQVLNDENIYQAYSKFKR